MPCNPRINSVVSLPRRKLRPFSKKQTGIISTAPVGAKITIRDSMGVFYKGVTPTEMEVQQGAFPVWTIIEKEGYETIQSAERWEPRSALCIEKAKKLADYDLLRFFRRRFG